MSHEVESMFSVVETPWHKLGVILDNPPTAGDAIKAAGLAWDVSLEPLFTADGTKVDRRVVRRSSDRAILGDVGPGYTVLQNQDGFAWFDPFLRAGECTLETAGSLRGGRRVWILARLNRGDSVIVPRADDKVVKYLLLSNSHDGSLAVRLGFTPTRVVCANTLAIAHTGANSSLLRVKHTASVRDTVEGIREIVSVANARFEATAEQYRWLAGRDISSDDLTNYVKVVFDLKDRVSKRAKDTAAHMLPQRINGMFALPPMGGFAQAELEEPKSRVLDGVRRAFEAGRGNSAQGVRGTWWAAYNAVTEYMQYDRRGTDESRLDSIAFGPGATTSAKALSEAVRMAA